LSKNKSMELFKARYDGNHLLFAPYKNVKKYKTDDIIFKSKQELKLDEKFEKKDLFINEWALIKFPFKNKGRKAKDDYYRRLDKEIKTIIDLLKKSNNKLSQDKLVQYIYDGLTSDYDLCNFFKFNFESEIIWLKIYIEKFLERSKTNLKARKALFRRKALNNEWNYFVTFTYDSNKHDENSFIKTLKKKLQNLHVNHYWNYMGCFERSKKERLHFHGLLFVPNGKMRGNIREESYYDTSAHKRAISFINEDFEKKIGRNDFKPINIYDLTFKKSLDYIIKYIGKTDEKIVYSRGLKNDFYCLVNYKDNLICKENNNSPYYIIGDETLVELNKDLEVKNLFN